MLVQFYLLPFLFGLLFLANRALKNIISFICLHSLTLFLLNLLISFFFFLRLIPLNFIKTPLLSQSLYYSAHLIHLHAEPTSKHHAAATKHAPHPSVLLLLLPESAPQIIDFFVIFIDVPPEILFYLLGVIV